MRFNILCVRGKVKGVLCSLPSLRYRPPSRREEMEETEIKKTGRRGEYSYLKENTLISIHRHF